MYSSSAESALHATRWWRARERVKPERARGRRETRDIRRTHFFLSFFLSFPTNRGWRSEPEKNKSGATQSDKQEFDLPACLPACLPPSLTRSLCTNGRPLLTDLYIFVDNCPAAVIAPSEVGAASSLPTIKSTCTARAGRPGYVSPEVQFARICLSLH